VVIRLISPEGRAEALARAAAIRQRDPARAARIRAAVAEAEACGDWRQRLQVQLALGEDAPTPAEIAARAAEIRFTWQVEPRGKIMPAKLDWPARARKTETEIAHRRIWTTLCGRYRVIENHYKLASMPTCFHAQILVYEAWEILSRHKSREAAQRACQLDATQWWSLRHKPK
jgi:hypothetical protein